MLGAKHVVSYHCNTQSPGLDFCEIDSQLVLYSSFESQLPLNLLGVAKVECFCFASSKSCAKDEPLDNARAGRRAAHCTALLRISCISEEPESHHQRP